MAYVKIRPRRSTPAEWEYDNPILAEGEFAIEVPVTGVGTGLCNAKIGDGVTPWKDLPYCWKAVTDENVEELTTRISAAEVCLQQLKANIVVKDENGELKTYNEIAPTPIVVAGDDGISLDNGIATYDMDGGVTKSLRERLEAIEKDIAAIQTVMLLVDDEA